MISEAVLFFSTNEKIYPQQRQVVKAQKPVTGTAGEETQVRRRQPPDPSAEGQANRPGRARGGRKRKLGWFRTSHISDSSLKNQTNTIKHCKKIIVARTLIISFTQCKYLHQTPTIHSRNCLCSPSHHCFLSLGIT